MKKKIWTKDWAAFDWNVVGKEVANEGSMAADFAATEPGITKEQFMGYLEWLSENDPERYGKVVFGIQMHEQGVDPAFAGHLCERSQQLIDLFELMQSGDEV